MEEKAEKKKSKKGRGGKKKKTKHTNNYPTDPDAEGYEVNGLFRITHRDPLKLSLKC